MPLEIPDVEILVNLTRQVVVVRDNTQEVDYGDHPGPVEIDIPFASVAALRAAIDLIKGEN